MALERLKADEVYRFGLAHEWNFADWTNPTVAELNANPTNQPSALIWNLTCALNQDGTQFDLDDPDLDESLTFCQQAGNGEVLVENATVVYEIERSKRRWMNAAVTTVPADPLVDGYDTANLALSLLAWRDVEYFAWMSIGKGPEEPFAIGDRISMIRVATDWGIDTIGTGENARMNNALGYRSDVLWRHEITA